MRPDAQSRAGSRTSILGPGRVAVQIVSVAAFALVWAAALFGDTDPFRNLAPTWVYVVFWLGVPLLSVLFGNVWRALSPWRALADGFVWLWEAHRTPCGAPGRRTRPGSAAGPQRPSCSRSSPLELAYSDPSSPRALAFAIALYTYVALFGMIAFGRETWVRSGEGFAVAFAYLARIAPLHAVDGRIRARWPFTGLGGSDRIPGSTAVVSVMLGSVLFDGYSRTTTWQDTLAEIEGPYLIDRPGVGELLVTLANLGGLLAGSLLVGLAYVAACSLARASVNAPRSLVPEFLLSLLPIAFVYLVAHYFTLFVIQGQFAIPLLSDPFGRGWDLLGTASFLPNLTPFTPNTVWYVQVGALVVGHVAALAVAHDRAIDVFESRRDALRSQYALLALMVLYTVGGLWVLSRG